MDKNAMYKFSYGLFVLTTKDSDDDNGCIINTAMQISSSPNRICIVVNKSNKTHDMIMSSRAFNISMISTDATFDLFERFGFQSGKDTNKFESYDKMKRSPNGIYYITEGTNAYVSAKVVMTTDLVSHTMFIADVTDANVLSEADSVTYTYYQDNIKPKPVQASEGKTTYVCKICGYIYDGYPLPEDFICPICKHGADDFEKVVS